MSGVGGRQELGPLVPLEETAGVLRVGSSVEPACGAAGLCRGAVATLFQG